MAFYMAFICMPVSMPNHPGFLQIEVDTDRDNMNPWEAKEYGLVDAVIDDGKTGQVAPIAVCTSSENPRMGLVESWR